MAFLTIVIDRMIPASATTIATRFEWTATDGVNFATDTLEIEQQASFLSSVLNQNLIQAAIDAAGQAGITIGVLDRKVVIGGFV